MTQDAPTEEIPGSSSHKADVRLLFVTRFIRMFAYGFLSVLLVLYLSKLGFSDTKIGLLLSLTLAGDIVVSLLLTTTADRFGRRRTLMVSSVLMLAAGIVFALTDNFLLLLAAATIGVISPSGNEVGPFLSVEQAALSHVITDQRRTHVFGWYNLVGSLATALGALASGGITQLMQNAGMPAVDSYRTAVWGYAGAGAILAVLFVWLSKAVEIRRDEANGASRTAGAKAFLGLHKSKGVVAKLSALFSIDAFAGGFVIQSIVAYWFYIQFKVEPAMLGAIFFGANILAAVSALAASKLAAKIGLINTMVFTHLPSNVLLILVPLMPNLYLAIAVLLLRFSISQMDVPTRQSYVMSVVDPDERSAAAGVTAVARSVGAAVSPSLATMFLACTSPLLLGAPFFIGGGLKIVYDLLLYRSFSAARSRAAAKAV
ncbi:MAG: MFS transporter [Planctomycetes bacterium]|nr:MFS transporter [Planctomycetota bacterium]